jgi:hypothetical protein
VGPRQAAQAWLRGCTALLLRGLLCRLLLMLLL